MKTTMPDPTPQDRTPFRILVTGSRTWTDTEIIRNALLESAAKNWITLVHGACPTGADDIADRFGRFCQWQVERHPADWGRYGRSAGFRRNAEMVALGADLCLAFIRDGSKGASNCADLAERAGIEVRRFEYHREMMTP
jgi:hypothetical protein